MRILGIDPGYERLGISIIESGQKPKLVFSDCFKTLAKDEHSKRLAQIHKEIENIIKKYKPEKLGIETLFFNKNVKTAIKVAEARGIILALAEKSGLEIFEISPQQIKIAVTGYGKSDKNAVAKMVPLLVEIDKEKSINLDDEFDAIAAALAVPTRN
jgi:crossover junction endodeoxyribonuclease RuvC